MSDQREGGIAWTDETWNPIRGCSRVSEGCRHCYAERVAARFSGPGQPYEGLVTIGEKGARWNGRVRIVREHLSDPLRWRRPRRVFVNSMSDLFHESIPFNEVAAIFGVMAAAREHTFQVLTKRPARALAFFEWLGHPAFEGRAPFDVCAEYAIRRLGTKQIARSRLMDPTAPWPPPNVWLGVSVEDQATADERIPLLLRCPAAVRWVSYEPALGPVRFDAVRERKLESYGGMNYHAVNALTGYRDEKSLDARLDWIVVGGESGAGARPFDVAWALSTIDQCKRAGVACFVKQLGANPFHGIVAGFPLHGRALSDRKGADMSEWPEALRVREWPKAVKS